MSYFRGVCRSKWHAIFVPFFWAANCCLCFQSWTQLTEHEAKCSNLHFVAAPWHFGVSRCRWMLWRERNARSFHQSSSIQRSLKHPTPQMNSFQRTKAIIKIADFKPLVCHRVPWKPRRLFSRESSFVLKNTFSACEFSSRWIVVTSWI